MLSRKEKNLKPHKRTHEEEPSIEAPKEDLTSSSRWLRSPIRRRFLTHRAEVSSAASTLLFTFLAPQSPKKNPPETRYGQDTNVNSSVPFYNNYPCLQARIATGASLRHSYRIPCTTSMRIHLELRLSPIRGFTEYFFRLFPAHLVSGPRYHFESFSKTAAWKFDKPLILGFYTKLFLHSKQLVWKWEMTMVEGSWKPVSEYDEGVTMSYWNYQKLASQKGTATVFVAMKELPLLRSGFLFKYGGNGVVVVRGGNFCCGQWNWLC